MFSIFVRGSGCFSFWLGVQFFGFGRTGLVLFYLGTKQNREKTNGFQPYSF